MLVTVDGQKIDRQFDTGESLQTVIDVTRNDLPPQRLVVNVRINGEGYSDDALAERLQQPIGPGDQVDLETSDPATLGAEALRTVAEQLKIVGGRQAGVADKLSGANLGEGVQEIGEFVQIWQQIQRVLTQLCGLTGQDLTQLVYEDKPVSQHLDALLERLREIRDALEAHDMVLLADLFHYEAPALCEQWTAILRHMADELAPTPA